MLGGAGDAPPPPHTLHPTPCTLHPTPYTLHPTPCTLHPTPYTLHPTPCNLHLTSYTPHPTPNTLHPTTHTPHPTGDAILPSKRRREARHLRQPRSSPLHQPLTPRPPRQIPGHTTLGLRVIKKTKKEPLKPFSGF